MRVARVVWTDGVNHLSDGSPVRLYREPAFYEEAGMVARHRFPLPPKRVLREEPDPHQTGLRWRWNNGLLEVCDETSRHQVWCICVNALHTPAHRPNASVCGQAFSPSPYREEPQ